MMKPTCCPHKICVKFCKFSNCVVCGALVSIDDEIVPAAAIKDLQSLSHSEVSASLLYSNMLNCQCRFYNPTASYLKA